MTSGSRLVNPQAMSALWPMITPGTPEKVKPATSIGHPVDTVRQCRPICIQMPGSEMPRCGSLASNGWPVEVWSPPTTHELLPMPSPRPTSAGTASRASCTRSNAAVARAYDGGGRSGLRVPPVAAWSKTPSTTAPEPTIGGWSS